MKQKLLLKTMLAAALLGAGASNAWADDGIKRTQYAQNYESATSSDWTSPNGSVKLITGDATYGNYSQLAQGGGSGHRTGSKSVTFAYAADGYTSSEMTVAGYVIEFDCNLITGDASGTGGSSDQIFVPTTSANIGTNSFYAGSDYIFCLSQMRGQGVARTGTWYVNDPSHSSESTIELSESKWYHVKLVCSATSIDYTITDNSTHSDIKTGSKTVTSLPSIKGIWGLVGRANGKINFDNLDIYDYAADFTIPAPTFSSGRVDGANRTYTLTNIYGAETLYYTTSPAAEAPAIGDAAYLSTSLVGKEVTFSEVGKYYAYVLHSNGTKTSAIAEVEISAVGEVTLATPEFTIVDFVLAEDGHYYPRVSFKSDNSGKEGAPTATFNEVSPYTFTSLGTLTVTASADGYSSSSNSFTVSSYYELTKTIDFGALTGDDFDEEVWTSGTGVPRSYWTSRSANIPADVPNRKLTNTSKTVGNPDNSAVVDGITISNYTQRVPEFCIGYGMYTPYDAISGSNNYMNFTVNGATATDYAVYNGWNNYGSGTFNRVLSGNATFDLYRYDTMLRTIKVYSPVSEVPTLSLDKTSESVETGEEVSFTATVTSGSPAPSLQWYSCDDAEKANASAIEGATAATYSPTTAEPGTYYLFVRASNSAGNTDSEVITLTITGTVATPTYTIASYNYEQGGYAITPACETEGATLTYKVGAGATQSCTAGETFYAKDGKLVITASKTGWASASTPSEYQYTLNVAPSSTSPETLISFNISNDNIEKNITHAYKSVAIAGGSDGAIAGRDGNGRLKLRTNQGGNTITLSVNSGYRVTGVTITANTNSSSSGKNVVMTGVAVDGGSNIMDESITLPLSNAAATSYSTGTISANNSIVFSFDNSQGTTQIMASIEVTYMTPTEVEVANAIADCKTYETSDAFATYIDKDTYISAAEVYAAHTAWQVENGTPSKAILNNAVTSTNHFWGTLTEGADYVGAPDTKYLANTAGSEYNVNQIVYQLPAGVYRASAWTYSSTTGWRKIYVSKVPAEGAWEDFITPDTSDEGWVELSGEFTLTEPANIAFGLFASAVSGRVAGFDNWTLTKIEDVSKTISSAGWSTYCSPYILDFSDAVDGLDVAYIVTGGADGVLTKTAVNGAVPAGTGLLLKGTADATVSIPVATTATVDVDANKLVGVVASETLPAKGGYVLMTSPSLAFYKNVNDFTLSANSAYLPANFDGASARNAFLLFGDDETGINAIEDTTANVKGYYNLSGQRVAQPQKGLYIVGGKKVVIK